MGISYRPGNRVQKYIYLVGDIQPSELPAEIQSAFSLSSFIPAEQIEDFKKRLAVMPRPVFNALAKDMLKDIAEISLPISLDNRPKVLIPLVNGNFELRYHSQVIAYAYLLDLFNEVNEQQALKKLISDNWLWEETKMFEWYRSQAESELLASNPELFLKTNTSEDREKMARRMLLESRYARLKPIKDLFVQTNRSAAIKLLLDQEEFDLAEKIIALYEGLSSNVNEALDVI